MARRTHRRLTHIPRNTWHPDNVPWWMPEHPDIPSLDHDEYVDDYWLSGEAEE